MEKSKDKKLWDCVVIGGGLMGKAISCNLAKFFKEVLIISKNHLSCEPKPRSYFNTGLVVFNSQSVDRTKLATSSFKKWKDLSLECNTQLYLRIGGIHIVPNGSTSRIQQIQKSLDLAHIQHSLVKPSEMAANMAANMASNMASNMAANMAANMAVKMAANMAVKMERINLKEDCLVVVERESGIIWMDDCHSTLLSCYEKRGGNWIADEVKNIVPVNSEELRPTFEITTEKRQIFTKNVVIAAGINSVELTRMLDMNLHITYEREYAFSFKINGDKLVFLNGASIFFFPQYIIIPSFGRAEIIKIICQRRIKVSSIDLSPEDDNDVIDLKNDISKFVKKYLISVDPDPVNIQYQNIATSPDQNFYLDKHPQWSNVIVTTAFSSRDAILALIVGELATSLLLCHQLPFDLKAFRGSRDQVYFSSDNEDFDATTDAVAAAADAAEEKNDEVSVSIISAVKSEHTTISTHSNSKHSVHD